MRGILLASLLICSTSAFGDGPIAFKKTIVSKKFLSEGVCIGDFNKDGKNDIFAGEVWFEAPDWKPHRIRPGKDDYTDGDKNVYSNSFACWAEDVNGDGWTDVIIVGFPGKPCYWYENPKNVDGPWKAHEIWHSACNETPLYADLLGTGKRVLVMGWQPKGKEKEGQMAYFTPAKDPTALWEMHPISEASAPGMEIPGTFKYAHGLGIGDINGDGKADVIIPQGWWEQPAKDNGKPWTFHKAALGAAAADMFAHDLDGDGKADVIASSAHDFGIWSYLQKSDGSFLKKDLFPKLFSQSHAMHLVDLNRDGELDLVTGKRRFAHGPKGDADPMGKPVLFWFEGKKAVDGVRSFTPHVIDEDSGIGTQFEVRDFNGDTLPDIVVANKHGVFLFERVK